MKKIVLPFVLCFVLLSCEDNNQTKEENQNISKLTSKGVNVKTTTLKPQTFYKQIISNGIIQTTHKAELHFKTSERIASIKVKNGQKVTKGQILATLDNDILNNQLNKAQNEIDKAKNKLLEEKINHGINIESEINPKLLQSLKIKSGLIDAENAYKNAQIQNSQSILKAPFSGLIANLNIKTGSFINASDVFCTLINQNKPEVVFSVLENELEFIKKGQTVFIQNFSNNEKEYKGSITEINPLVDKNGLIQIKARIDDNNASFLEGMHVKIKTNQPIKDVLVIPKEALVLRSNREVVFTVKNGLAKWNYINIVEENSTSYAVSKGLKVTDTIIISGNLNLSHDAKVNTSFIEITE